MIKVLLINDHKPDEINQMYIGDHIFVMSAKKVGDHKYDLDTVICGKLSVSDLINNLAFSIKSQLNEVSDSIGASYTETQARFISAFLEPPVKNKPEKSKGEEN